MVKKCGRMGKHCIRMAFYQGIHLADITTTLDAAWNVGTKTIMHSALLLGCILFKGGISSFQIVPRCKKLFERWNIIIIELSL